jgi:toxin CcdB
MARFDVYASPIADMRRTTPFWLDVQADHLHALDTRVIVPLRKLAAGVPLKARLNPDFVFDKVPVFADTANLGVFPLALLRRPVGTLREQRLVIDDALDFLFSGY